MRNLYKHLSLYRGASLEAINDAIRLCPFGKLRDDATSVFSNAKRKELYDHTHTTLSKIGKLRAGLEMADSENWHGPLKSEFEPHSTSPLRLNHILNPRTRHTKIPKPKTPKERQPLRTATKIKICLFLMSCAFSGLLVLSESAHLNQVSTEASQRDTNGILSTETLPEPEFNVPSILPPLHGTLKYNTPSTPVAPFEVITSDGGYYLIKLENVSTGRPDIELFVHGGKSIEIKVPLGTYIMKYAAGSKWYGHEYYFGPNTAYSKADSLFRFKEDFTGYSGYTVTLYQVRNGNLDTERISAEEF